MRDPVFKELFRADLKAFPLIKSRRVALGFDTDPGRMHFSPDLSDPFSEQPSAKAGAMLQRQLCTAFC